uniref:Prokineticin domain-containing protein n=1 Tax=Magallana gigas TaxID=29159 RepID=K1RJZ2_MAGGI
MCNLATDCHDNECCVSNVRPIGKRQTSFHGHCIPLGKVGDGCLVRNGNATSRPTELVFACPCTPGLYCHGDHHYDIPLGEIGITDAAATNKGCNSATECLDNECCVSIYQPLGRRQLHGHYSGHCVPMGMDGDGCLVRTGNATTRPLDVVLSCPCTPGLYCHGDHLYVVPLGEQVFPESPTMESSMRIPVKKTNLAFESASN